MFTTKSEQYYYLPLATAIIAVVFLACLTLTETVLASEPPHPPVPNYSGYISTAEGEEVTIPDNLANEWRGLYTIGTSSLITRENLPLQNYITNAVAIRDGIKSQKRTYKYNPKAIFDWTKQVADSINSKTSEPELEIKDGRAVKFVPPTYGKAVDRYHSTMKIIEQLQDGKKTAPLVVYRTAPQNELSELNDLGIKELVGRGESKFNGSPANRRWNIRVGVEKMTGVIVKPGEEFSFNKYLGPVEASTGFKPELVIKRTGTVPEFGGGLCQVSSTTFRAAMHAGLPITARRNHSYAVQYYAPQGTDATIYPGVQDLKFTNDTGNSILIWPYLKDENYLVFDFYGTYDNRKVELGTPYSYDRQSSGAMKATWTRTVTREGEEPKKDTFYSVYQSPALFHKQEEFPSAPGTTPTPTPWVGQPPVTPTGSAPTASPTTPPNSNQNSNDSD